MIKYDFDTPIDRRGTACMKYDEMESMFGRSDLIPLWIADMDFAVCQEIIDACSERLKHPVFGYTGAPQSYWDSIINWQKRRNSFDIKREEMTFIPGIVKGVSFAIVGLTQPGDKIVIQPPVYHPFKRVIEQNGRVAVTNPLIEPKPRSGESYKMDLEGLRKVIEREKPKML
ncbi:MAG: aminotransferase class I/II-fold pyridoxal phosphate-dependent enzyme, partial [Muribaculaceae bacterium]|nr:aminotransferase class I/II-fold pyridoxal phosphate-dependent enzyme [Muribaculaceae bacterium]